MRRGSGRASAQNSLGAVSAPPRLRVLEALRHRDFRLLFAQFPPAITAPPSAACRWTACITGLKRAIGDGKLRTSPLGIALIDSVSYEYRDLNLRYLDIGKTEGATLAYGGERLEQYGAAALVPALALARVEGRVHIGGRSLLDAGREHEQDPVILRQVERVAADRRTDVEDQC